MNELINDRGDCRTAQATQGLLKKLIKKENKYKLKNEDLRMKLYIISNQCNSKELFFFFPKVKRLPCKKLFQKYERG